MYGAQDRISMNTWKNNVAECYYIYQPFQRDLISDRRTIVRILLYLVFFCSDDFENEKKATKKTNHFDSLVNNIVNQFGQIANTLDMVQVRLYVCLSYIIFGVD